jgi:sortase A
MADILKNKKPENPRTSPLRGKRLAVTVLLAVLALALLAVGVMQLLDRYTATNGTDTPPAANSVVTEDSAEPSETKPDTSNYVVAAKDPRSITIGSIGVDGLIQKVGLTKDNAVATPNNVHIAGWYTSSVRPGEPGLSVIDGHVSGKYADGIFKNLRQTKAGDSFMVEFGDKSNKRFEVVEVRTLPERSSAEYLFTKRNTISNQLNLITCGGKFNKSTQTYDDRVIVVSKYQP